MLILVLKLLRYYDQNAALALSLTLSLMVIKVTSLSPTNRAKQAVSKISLSYLPYLITLSTNHPTGASNVALSDDAM